MSSEQEIAKALPSNFDVQGLSNAFSNPAEAFSMLDTNGDGRVTIDDLQALLGQFGITGPVGKAVAKLIFKKLDADKSGSIEPSDLISANGILTSLLQMKET